MGIFRKTGIFSVFDHRSVFWNYLGEERVLGAGMVIFVIAVRFSIEWCTNQPNLFFHYIFELAASYISLQTKSKTNLNHFLSKNLQRSPYEQLKLNVRFDSTENQLKIQKFNVFTNERTSPGVRLSFKSGICQFVELSEYNIWYKAFVLIQNF